MQLSRGSGDSTVMLLFLPKGNFSSHGTARGRPCGLPGQVGTGYTGVPRAEPTHRGWSCPGDPAPHEAHQQLLWGSPLSPCIPKSYPYPTLAVWCHGARPSHAASARPLWGSPSPPSTTRGSAVQRLPVTRPRAPRNAGTRQQGRAGAWAEQGCAGSAARVGHEVCSAPWDQHRAPQPPAVPGASHTPTLVSAEMNVGVAYREP